MTAIEKELLSSEDCEAPCKPSTPKTIPTTILQKVYDVAPYFIAWFIIILFAVYFYAFLFPYILKHHGNSMYILFGFISLFLFFFLWSFLMTTFTDPGYVKEDAAHGEGDVCVRCHLWKPLRSHHCSKCDKCVTRMDHHCVFANNCVGSNNRRYFIQLLAYGALFGLCYQIASAFGVSSMWQSFRNANQAYKNGNEFFVLSGEKGYDYSEYYKSAPAAVATVRRLEGLASDLTKEIKELSIQEDSHILPNGAQELFLSMNDSLEFQVQATAKEYIELAEEEVVSNNENSSAEIKDKQRRFLSDAHVTMKGRSPTKRVNTHEISHGKKSPSISSPAGEKSSSKQSLSNSKGKGVTDSMEKKVALKNTPIPAIVATSTFGLMWSSLMGNEKAEEGSSSIVPSDASTLEKPLGSADAAVLRKLTCEGETCETLLQKGSGFLASAKIYGNILLSNYGLLASLMIMLFALYVWGSLLALLYNQILLMCQNLTIVDEIIIETKIRTSSVPLSDAQKKYMKTKWSKGSKWENCQQVLGESIIGLIIPYPFAASRLPANSKEGIVYNEVSMYEMLESSNQI